MLLTWFRMNIYMWHTSKDVKNACVFLHVKAKVLERKWKERVRKEMHGMFGWVCECFVDIITYFR